MGGIKEVFYDLDGNVVWAGCFVMGDSLTDRDVVDSCEVVV